jgi:hypothetical protein
MHSTSLVERVTEEIYVNNIIPANPPPPCSFLGAGPLGEQPGHRPVQPPWLIMPDSRNSCQIAVRGRGKKLPKEFTAEFLAVFYKKWQKRGRTNFLMKYLTLLS